MLALGCVLEVVLEDAMGALEHAIQVVQVVLLVVVQVVLVVICLNGR